MKPLRTALAALALVACASAHAGAGVVLPAERNAYARPSTSAEMAQALAAIAASHPDVAAVVTIGESALGQPLEALLLAPNAGGLLRGRRAADRLTVLLVGSQHGNEPAGGEALLGLAADVAAGAGRGSLDAYDLIVVPNANPDGRDRRRRGNGRGVNLSTNFVTLSEPESRAIVEGLSRWQPDVVLDVHESATFKPSTLARQGYLTDFEAQLGTANNANLHPAARALGRVLLDETLTRIDAGGLPGGEYIGEITDVNAPITHGGLSARNLRNAAGLRGALAFVLENRLDRRAAGQATPKNLAARIAKQRLCIDAFLAVCRLHRDEILARTADARRAAAAGRTPLRLVSRWAAEPGRSFIDLPLRRLDGSPEVRRFAYHGSVVGEHPLPMPRAYAAVAHQAEIQALLTRHHVATRVLEASLRVTATTLRIESRTQFAPRLGVGWSAYDLAERTGIVELPIGSLWIPLDQPGGRLVPLLLEPRSDSSLFEEPAYESWVQRGADFFILRVDATP